MQSNLDVAEQIAERARAFVPNGARVVELYAGSGMVGLGLLGRVEACTFNEVAPGGVEGLRLGLASTPAPHRSRATVVEGPASTCTSSIDGATALIVDPPRKGLEPAVLERLAAQPPRLLVYVACGLEAFARDARALTESERLRLRHLEVFDLFPHTDHAEIVAAFESTQ
jgi:tRNA/tmRNA/rRNA uracil-C5-methylase (TrmA/RlmC/RlmD family)